MSNPTHVEMAAPSLLPLPYELYRNIVEEIAAEDVSEPSFYGSVAGINALNHRRGRTTATGTLFALLLVSRALNREVERILYRRLSISCMPLKVGLRLLSLLSSCPRIASHVQDLCAPMYRHSYQVSALNDALRSLPNLRRLSINSGLGVDRRIFAIFNKCTFELTSLTIHGEPDEDVWNWIEKCQSLKEFCWNSVGVSVMPDVSGETFQHLETLEGSIGFVSTVLEKTDEDDEDYYETGKRRRRIRRLRVTDGDFHSIPFRPEELAVRNIQSLSISFDYTSIRTTLLSDLAHFRSLQYLTITPMDDGDTPPADIVVSALLPLKFLRKVLIGLPADDGDGGNQFSRRLFAEMPLLECVQVITDWTARTEWSRDGQSTIKEFGVQSNDADEWRYVELEESRVD